jgi:tetratricopeptide (TPR) repeat protein
VLWFSYLIGLAPVLGLFMSFRHAAADRYTYLPTLGLWLLVGLAVARVWQLSGRLSRGAVPAKAGIIVVVAAIGSALAIHTHSQIGVWRNSETLWNYVLTRAEHVPALAFYATGKELEKKGDLDQAFTYYEIAQALDPPNPHYASELANVISKKGDRETALKMFKEILERYPDIVGHHRNVGRMYVLLERYDEAIPHLERALQMAPENGGSLFLLAFTYLKKGDVAQARSYYERYLSAGYSRREEIEPALGMDKDKDRGTGGVSR